jgi:hypothetical protein
LVGGMVLQELLDPAKRARWTARSSDGSMPNDLASFMRDELRHRSPEYMESIYRADPSLRGFGPGSGRSFAQQARRARDIDGTWQYGRGRC